MADTARPQTPNRRLFKPSSKTPPVRKPHALVNTPQSVPSATKSNSPGTPLFKGSSSGSSPKLVRKASLHGPSTPSRSTSNAAAKPRPRTPAVEDIVKSTPLAPLTSKRDVANGDIPEYAASDTTDDTPIGLIDNDVLTPTDTVSRSTNGLNALSRQASHTMTGAAGGPPGHDSALTGSGNEKAETGKGATNDLLEPASKKPNEAPQQASEQRDAGEQVASQPSDHLSRNTQHPPGVDDIANQRTEPTDLTKYFLDQGHPEMSEFVKALLSPTEDSAPAANGAPDSAAKDTGQEAVDVQRNPELKEFVKALLAPSEDPTSSADTALDSAKSIAKKPVDKVRDSVPVPKPSKEPGKETPTSNHSTLDRLREELPTDSDWTLDSSGKDQDIPEAAQHADDGLISEPTSKANVVAKTIDSATDNARGTVSGFPDVSADPIQELPNSDEMVAKPTSKVEAPSKPAESLTSNAHDTVGGFPDVAQDPAKELPTDDGLVVEPASKVQSASSKTQEEGQDTVDNIGKQGDKAADSKSGVPDTEGISKGKKITGDAAGKPLDAQQGPNGSATGAMAGAKEDLAAKAPQKPDASSAANQAKGTTGGGIQAQADNMGNPARVNRRVEIPLPMPERKPSPARSGMEMPDVDNLKSTDGLPNVDDIDDPPEEFLDPSIHSPEQPSANISPIPKIAKVSPITSEPPPDLARLANGLAGYSIDDVGNIVDESGKVLGHATGDLPTMIGKKVAANGEVYGDNGELIGFVTDNFTGHPPPPEAPKPASSGETPLPGGLKVDTNGNILDSSGNIIGKLHNKSGDSSKALTPYIGKAKDEPKTQTDGEGERPEGEEKPRAKFDEGGIPADIFLDVKSTPDGIQLTIRIPTIFKQETRQTAE